MPPSISPARAGGRAFVLELAVGFAAGFLAVLVFHQLTVAAIAGMGLIQSAGVWRLDAYGPLGVPRVLNTAFWGGVWGVVLAAVRPWLPTAALAFLICGFLFGIAGPTLFGWFVLAPLRGQPAAQGFKLAAMWRGPAINGMWGLGAAFFLLLFDRLRRGGRGRTY
ncbi:MAG: hypothetical protein ACT4N4_12985 [Rhodospirillales bacterium]